MALLGTGPLLLQVMAFEMLHHWEISGGPGKGLGTLLGDMGALPGGLRE